MHLYERATYPFFQSQNQHKQTKLHEIILAPETSPLWFKLYPQSPPEGDFFFGGRADKNNGPKIDTPQKVPGNPSSPPPLGGRWVDGWSRTPGPKNSLKNPLSGSTGSGTSCRRISTNSSTVWPTGTSWGCPRLGLCSGRGLCAVVLARHDTEG